VDVGAVCGVEKCLSRGIFVLLVLCQISSVEGH
jgi:hypothetical protein